MSSSVVHWCYFSFSYYNASILPVDHFKNAIRIGSKSKVFCCWYASSHHCPCLRSESSDFEEDFEETELKEEIVWFPQLFTHNTTIEVVWTIIPAIILVCIAIPSFSLLYAMDQIWQPLFTIKVLGNQWYWSYEYC